MKRATVATPPGMDVRPEEISVDREHFSAEVEAGPLEDLTDVNTRCRRSRRSCHRPFQILRGPPFGGAEPSVIRELNVIVAAVTA